MKEYIKPKLKLIQIQINLMTNSYQQCDCYQYREYGGCIGCKGYCGCNHWDGDSIVPGC